MNENKNGKKYKSPDSFILIIGYIRIYFHLPYRQTEGIIKATIGKNLPDHPCYSQICRRVNKSDIDINSSTDDDVRYHHSSSGQYRYQGYKQRSRWMQDKWNVKDKKGYLKIHVAVNIKTKEILALEVTDEKVHDSKLMKNLVEGVLNNNRNVKVKSFLGDGGAYDSNEIQILEGEKDSAHHHQSKKELYRFIQE